MSKSHHIVLGETRLIPDLSGAAYLPAERALLVADLHLEQGRSLARRGVHLPPYDSLATLTALEKVLQHSKAEKLFLLGDSFHDRLASSELPDAQRHRLMEITSNFQTTWLSGNHDPDPPAGFAGSAAAEVALGALILRHIPAAVTPGQFEIAGHLHPGASVLQRNHRLRGKCFISDGRRLILPAFGAYTGALNVRDRAFDGLFDPSATQVWLIGEKSLHRFPLRRLD